MKLTNPFKRRTNNAQDRTGYSADTEAAIAKRLDDFENQGVVSSSGPERTDGGDAQSLYSNELADTTGPTSDEGSEMTESNVFWARTKSGTSWHILRETDDKTLCGKNARYGEHEDVRPTGKTCETCLRQVSPK